MVLFNTIFLRTGFEPLRYHFETAVHDIVPATQFADTGKSPAEYHNKVVIGRLLSITNPDNAGGYFGGRSAMQAVRASGPNAQRRRVPHPQTSILLVFGDYYDKPNCFCLFLNRKLDFQRLFGGENIARSETVRVGDMFAIKDPRPSAQTLGESIIILREPTIVSLLVPQGWPNQALVASTDTNWQVFFDETGKTIQVYGQRIDHDNQKCKGYTCDQQGGCKGCFGRTGLKKSMVLSVDVEVLDSPQYSSCAVFYRFKSLRFTNLFFADFKTLTRAHQSVLGRVHLDIVPAVHNIVAYVNANGGWRVCGWHRQGLRTEQDTGEDILSSNTMGHLVLLEPTNARLKDLPTFKAMQVNTPSENTTPHTPPAQGYARQPSRFLPAGENHDSAASRRSEATHHDSNASTQQKAPPFAKSPLQSQLDTEYDTTVHQTVLEPDEDSHEDPDPPLEIYDKNVADGQDDADAQQREIYDDNVADEQEDVNGQQRDEPPPASKRRRHSPNAPRMMTRLGTKTTGLPL
jgi:hypothetical protein